jgi:hypothetical protein
MGNVTKCDHSERPAGRGAVRESGRESARSVEYADQSEAQKWPSRPLTPMQPLNIPDNAPSQASYEAPSLSVGDCDKKSTPRAMDTGSRLPLTACESPKRTLIRSSHSRSLMSSLTRLRFFHATRYQKTRYNPNTGLAKAVLLPQPK